MHRLGALLTRHHQANWALADQSVVSGSNFIIGILLARFLGPEAFGLFVVLQAVILYVNSFQGALIFQPMMSAVPQMPAEKRQPYLRGVFALQLMLTLSLALLTGIIAWGADAWFGFDGLSQSIVLSLVAALLSFQLLDWQRRHYFVEENARGTFLIDTIAYGGQTVLITAACLTDQLTVSSAFWIIAVTAFSGFAVGLLDQRLHPLYQQASAVLSDGWRAGRDYLIAWQFQLLGAQGVLMIGAGAVGTHAVGGIRATQNIVGPINILFQAMENLLPIAAATRYSQRGLAGLCRFLWRVTLLGSLALLPLLLLLGIFAKPLIQTLYGDDYLSYVALVYWQVAYVVIQFYQRQVFYFLRTVKATGVVLRSGFIMASLSLLIAAISVHRWQESGLMLALVASTGVALLYTCAAAWKIARQIASHPYTAPSGAQPAASVST